MSRMSGIDHSILNGPRRSGVLLHPTSLAGVHGIGSFGPESYQFIDFLVAGGQRLWQVCPLGPTGYGDSPYQCLSALAGNALLIGLEALVEAGYLDGAALADSPGPGERVDYGAVIPWKKKRLAEAYDGFLARASTAERARLSRFERLHAEWLDDYALFVALKEQHDGRPWTEWEVPLRDRHPDALAAFREAHAHRIALAKFLQWIFHSQWSRIRSVAAVHGIRVVGDLPIFVAHDSADVWANRRLFHLDGAGNPTAVAGVPPDYFSATGQLWGNPVYNWDVHRAEQFAWWIGVLRSKFAMYDFVRIDHFRGFSAYWSVPASEETALNGQWVPSPGAELFRAAEEQLGRLPVIAEDLGVITPDVVELIERFGFARMKVLQFAFDAGEQNLYLPYQYEQNAVVYTGTHDNDTVSGWLASTDEADRAFALDYLRAGDEPHWDFVQAAIASAAHFAIVPAQDLLGLGPEARMNTPGTLGGNWQFRLLPDQLSDAIAHRLHHMSSLYGRI